MPCSPAAWLERPVPATALELTKTWGGTLAFEHYWTPSLRTSWVAGYLEVEYSDAAKQLLVNRGRWLLVPATGMTLQPTQQCANADWSMWRLASRTMWNPVQNLDVGLEVAYTKVNTAFGGAGCIWLPTRVARAWPAGAYNLDDNAYWTATFRVQRNFWP